MAFTDQYTLSQDAVFQGRVKVAMAKVAVAVVGEAKGAQDFRDWRKRHALGVAILNDPDSYVDKFVMATVTNAAITGASKDGDIEFQVTAVYPDIAGVGLHPKL